MPTTSASLAPLGRLAPVVPLVAMAAAMMAPRGSAATFIAIALVPVLALLFLEGLRTVTVWTATPFNWVLLALGVYLAVNALWSADRGEALGKVVFFWLLLALGWLAGRGMGRLDDQTLERLARGVIVGTLIGALFLAIEVLSGQWIKRSLFNLLPMARPDPKHINVQGGAVISIGDYVLNRSFAVLCLAVWPTLLMLRSLLSVAAARIAAGVLLVLTGVGVFNSAHETSMLAVAFAGVAFVGVLLLPRVLRPMLVVGWIAATILVVPIAVASYAAGLHQAQWIPDTGRQRIILWSVTATKSMQAPLLGVGVAATKSLDERAMATAERREGHSYPQRTGRHAHNIFMQTWYELGAVGAVLLLAIGLLLLRQLFRLPPEVQPYALASFVSAVLIGAFSWGIWQTWFMAAYGIWALLLMLAIEIARRRGGGPIPR
ncbi:MAG: O-antigen ligase family protein [Hyphomicrobiaceae bacterium]